MKLIDRAVQMGNRTVGWWQLELGGKVWSVFSSPLDPDEDVPIEWDGLTNGKVYDIVDEDGKYRLTVPRLKDAEPNIRCLRRRVR